MNIWPTWTENKPFAALLLLLVAATTVLLGAKAYYLGNHEPYEHTISVTAQGRADAATDIATLQLGVESKGKDAAAAQAANTKASRAMMEKVKTVGIPSEDLKTSSYNIYEEQVWDDNLRKKISLGWIASQTVTVKVRDVEKVAAVLEAAGQGGATSISGPSFTIDDPQALEDEARENAIVAAHARAQKIAQALGVRLGRVVAFSQGDDYPTPYYAKAMRAEAMDSGGLPPVERGEKEVTVSVSITYEMK